MSLFKYPKKTKRRIIILGDIFHSNMSCPHRILITGGSGYLGGTLLARWSEAHLPPTMYDKLFALVRTDAQAQAVQQLYGAEPLVFHPQEEASVREAIVGNKITIVYYLIDAVHSGPQVHMIKALAEVKKLTGQQVHFLHVGGILQTCQVGRY